MAAPFPGLSASALRRLAEAFRSGRLAQDATAFSITSIAGGSLESAAEIARLRAEGMSLSHLALLLDACASAEEARARHAEVDLVWTGPESPHAFSRDTAVVVRELFGQAQRDVIVSTFVVRQAATVFAPLIQRMDAVPDLKVRIFLHVGREWRDTALESELLREFSEHLRRDWPSLRRPEIYYDPRGLQESGDEHATWHAKCVVVDEDVAFVTSANFTERAHIRNVEAGALIRSAAFVRQLRHQFDHVVQARLVKRLPGF